MNITLYDFNERFGSKKACYSALLNARTGAGLGRKCLNPVCLSGNIDRDYVLLRERSAFFCKKCLKSFYPMNDSVLSNSKIPLECWFDVIFRFLSHKNGVSSLEIRRDYGLTEKSAFYMLHSIREQMGRCLSHWFENTVVEIDESYILTGNKGMSRHFPWKKGRGSDHTDSVLIIKERNGYVRMFCIDDCSADVILDVIEKNVDTSCTIYTDEWPAYSSLKDLGYKHEYVNHGNYEFKKGSASTNADENAWSYLKRSMKGVYGSVSPQYLQNYLDERCFRSNFSAESDYGFTRLLLSFPSLYDSYKKDNPFMRLGRAS